ncbi:hypothetical protein [Streptomyces sp. NPDC095613]|uniref:hypothetical protein n=1 Tax=Streptomyces sp. NPDC095613 TaxID=3155540 RepID=UPI003332951D
MPRGRHRHSPPLHKLLPPSAVAGAAVLCAAGAWFLSEPVVLRGLVAATAVAAVTGAVLMRSWDRSAGRRVAELTRARDSDQWKTDERVAELEADVEEARELRVKLEAKLRSKRVELAGLRGEHAALLRRYATAETERASALEGRRRLALEAAAEPKALLAGAGGTPTAAVYVSAARALDELSRNGAAQQARRTVEAARQRDLAERAAEADEPQGKHAAGAGGEQHSRPAPALPTPRVPAASAIVPYSATRPVRRPEGGFDFFGTQGAPAARGTGGDEDTPTGQAPDPGPAPAVDADMPEGTEAMDAADAADAATEAADAADTRDAADVKDAAGTPDGTDARAATDAPDEGGARTPAGASAERESLESVEREDLADVVGEEVLAERRKSEGRAVGKVIDLTAHDETEQFPLGGLRDRISS